MAYYSGAYRGGSYPYNPLAGAQLIQQWSQWFNPNFSGRQMDEYRKSLGMSVIRPGTLRQEPLPLPQTGGVITYVFNTGQVPTGPGPTTQPPPGYSSSVSIPTPSTSDSSSSSGSSSSSSSSSSSGSSSSGSSSSSSSSSGSSSSIGDRIVDGGCLTPNCFLCYTNLIDHLEFLLGVGFDTSNGYLPVVVCDRVDPAPGPWNCYNGGQAPGVPPCYAGKWCLNIYPATECGCPFSFCNGVQCLDVCTDSGGICGCAVLSYGCPDSPGTTHVCGGRAFFVICADYSWIDVTTFLGFAPFDGTP